jgi:homoserine dehydrogenase
LQVVDLFSAIMPAIAVGVVGPGLVGKALLEQLEAHGRKYGGNALVRVAGVINSSKMLLLKEVCLHDYLPQRVRTLNNCRGCSQQDNWVSELAKWPNEASAASMDEFVKHMEKQVCALTSACTCTNIYVR